MYSFCNFKFNFDISKKQLSVFLSHPLYFSLPKQDKENKSGVIAYLESSHHY